MAIIDLSFVLVGKTVPIDHGYALFSALCRIVPELHGDRRVGVQPIRGRQSAPGVLTLLKQSRLRIRIESERIAPYIAVAGKVLDLGEGHRLRVGIPQVEPLRPAANLGARLVTFRHAMDPAAFEADVRRELERMEIAAEPHFVPTARPKFEGQPKRRVMKVKDRTVVGYALRVLGLTAEESIRLQEEGLGGRRRMGSGVFTPVNVPL
jgi:CRISPR-associated protein Cas6